MFDDTKKLNIKIKKRKKPRKVSSATQKPEDKPLTIKQTKVLAARLGGATLKQAGIEAGYSEKSADVLASQALSKLNVKAKLQEVQNEIILMLYNKLFEYLESDDLDIEKKIDVVRDMLDRQGQYKKSQPANEGQSMWGNSDMLALFYRHKRTNDGNNGQQWSTIEWG